MHDEPLETRILQLKTLPDNTGHAPLAVFITNVTVQLVKFKLAQRLLYTEKIKMFYNKNLCN